MVGYLASYPKKNYGDIGRNEIRTIFASLLLAIVCFADAWAAEEGPRWSYEGDTGPAHWGHLSPNFAACAKGQRQSPIDLGAAVEADLPGVKLNYSASPLRIINSGHTVQVNVASGNTLTVGKEAFELVQVHFHAPSEHTLEGRQFAMEAHLVHRDDNGVLAVLGVFMELGEHNKALDPIWSAMPKQAGPEKTVAGSTFNAADLLPENELEEYFRYNGSLTTPPCSEGVHWFILPAPVRVSQEQVALFEDATEEHHVARPVQDLNDRFVLRNKD